MYRLRAKSGWHIIDNKMIYTDSKMEAMIIARLVKNGFSLKWRRSRSGISFGAARYTPDIELCVMHSGESMRAIVELKAFSATEFKLKDRERMLAAINFYYRAIPLLYVEAIKQWYYIERTGELIKIAAPAPGLLNITQLPKPRLTIPILNRYGRSYSSLPSNLALRKLADGLQFGVNVFLRPMKRRRIKSKK
jgi:hypothetical protein